MSYRTLARPGRSILKTASLQLPRTSGKPHGTADTFTKPPRPLLSLRRRSTELLREPVCRACVARLHSSLLDL